MLPFTIYHTFVIEQRYGFNRTTVGTFVVDRLKEWCVSALLMGGFASIVLILFEFFGLRAWIVAWICTAAISVILVYLAPIVILPFFFKFSPVPAGDLRDQVTDFCLRQRFPVRELLVIDGSRRSSKANAFFTGFGPNKRIALYDTLINNHTVPELLAVLAHEVGHFKKHHIIQHFVFGQFNLLLLFLGASFCISRPELFEYFWRNNALLLRRVNVVFDLNPTAGSVDSAFWLISGVDKHEFEADRFAAEALGDPNPADSGA